MIKDPIQKKAYSEIQQAIRKKDLPPASYGTCSMCEVNQEIAPGIRMIYHHEDYERPLDVIVLCDKCHKKVHAKPKKIRIKIRKERKKRSIDPDRYIPTPRKWKYGDHNIMKVVTEK